MENSIGDDVFETSIDAQANLNVAHNNREKNIPSPTGYRDYKPPLEVIKLCESDTIEDSDQTVHKTILLGDSGVGKTSLLVKFDTGKFQPGNFSATVGIGFTNKVVAVDNARTKLQIWDTAGQERFRSITHAYYRDAHALLLLYDVTNKSSFDNIRAWLGKIREYAQDNVVIMLIGNKSDCGSQRTVRKEDGERLAKENDVNFMETSAKSGLNVDLAFLTIARELKQKLNGQKDSNTFTIQDSIGIGSQKANCPPCSNSFI